MLSFGSFKTRDCQGLSRRSFLKASAALPFAAGLAGLDPQVLAEAGARVICTDRNGEGAIATAAAIRSSGTPCSRNNAVITSSDKGPKRTGMVRERIVWSKRSPWAVNSRKYVESMGSSKVLSRLQKWTL